MLISLGGDSDSLSPCAATVYEVMRSLHDTGNAEDRPRSGRRRVVPKEFVEEVNRRLLQSTGVTVVLSEHVEVSRSAVHRAVKILRMQESRFIVSYPFFVITSIGSAF